MSDENVPGLAKAIEGYVVVDAAVVANVTHLDQRTCRVSVGGVVGWAAATSGIQELHVRHGDTIVASGWVGVHRMDVHQLYPALPGSETSGFAIDLAGAILPSRELIDLTIVAYTENGGAWSAGFQVLLPIGHTHSVASTPLIPKVRLMVELAELAANRRIRVAGWCASFSEILAIQIFIGEKHIGSCDIGIVRRDIATEYCYYPNASHSGFHSVFTLPESLVSRIDRIRVEALTVDGVVRSVSRPLQAVQEDLPQFAPAQRSFDAWHRTEPVGHAGPTASALQIRYNFDEIRLDTKGLLFVSGWLISEFGIDHIEICCDGALVGSAAYGLSRPDVGRIHADIPHSAGGGCRFEQAVASPPGPGLHTIEIRAILKTGAVETVAVDVVAMEPVTESDGEEDSIRFHLDSPVIGELPVTVSRGFTIGGWAVAQAGVARVEVEMDAKSLGSAYYGARREDIGAHFEGWPSALTSGFALSVPSHMLKDGDHQFVIRIVDREGQSRESHFKAIVQAGDQCLPCEIPRKKVSHAEVMTSGAVLAAAGVNIHLAIVLRLRVSSRGIEETLRTIRSVERQCWGDWRIYLAPYGGTASEVLQALALKLRPEALAKIAATDSPEMKNSWVAVLQAGDLVACDLLLNLGLALVDSHEADFIYGDERRRSIAGHWGTYFKPDWSPDLLLAQNYIGRAFVVHGSLLCNAGLSFNKLARRTFYHLALLLTEHARCIEHVPKVLLEQGSSFQETTEQELSALQQAILRRGLAARVSAGLGQRLYRVERTLAKPGKVSIIMPSIGARDLIKISIRSIRERTTHTDYEIIVLDNIRGEVLSESQLAWKEWFRLHADIVVEVNEKFNWSRLNNIGAAHASGDYLLFLNDDIEVLDPNWLNLLMSEAERDEVGAVGPQLLYPDRKVQHAGIFFAHGSAGGGRHAFRFAASDDPGYFGLALSQRNVSSVTGACLMCRREVYDRVSGFNEAHDVINNDVDFCLRVIRSGYLVVYTPFTQLIHHELASRAEMKDDFDRSGFISEWRDFIEKGDPFYNINLGRNSDDYAVDDEPIRAVFAGYPLGDYSKIQRILVVKLDHLGDVVTSLPAIRRLRKRFPQAKISVLVAKSSVGVAQLEPAIDEILEFQFFDARSSKGYRDLGEEDYKYLQKMLHARHFDLALDLRKPGDTRHVLKYSGAPLLAGIDSDRRDEWLDFSVEWEKDPLHKQKKSHVAADLVNFVDSLANSFEADRRGLLLDDAHPLPPLSDSLIDNFRALFARPYISVQPASGNPLRQWPPEHFATLINLLVEKCAVNVAIIGGPDERDIADAVLIGITQPESVFDLVGKSKVADLAGLLKRSAVFVGNNSGPHHLSAALGVPTVGVHSGVVTSEEWGPLGPISVAMRRDTNCSPCYRGNLSDCHRNIECVRSLFPYEVFRTCQRFLKLAAANGIAMADANVSLLLQHHSCDPKKLANADGE